MSDAEWAVLEPFLPPPSHVGRPRKWPIRRIVEAILYLLRGGLAAFSHRKTGQAASAVNFEKGNYVVVKGGIEEVMRILGEG